MSDIVKRLRAEVAEWKMAANAEADNADEQLRINGELRGRVAAAEALCEYADRVLDWPGRPEGVVLRDAWRAAQ